VLLDTDARCEADDQHFIGYALFSDLDVLGVSSVQNGDGTESINYGEIHYIFRLARRSGLPAESVPMAFHGADTRLEIPESGKWQDAQPIVTEASEAVLAAARGASPESPAWILPVGAGTNVASAILQARREGLDLKQRIRIIWLGGHAEDYHKEHNGHYDPWSVYVMGQSGIDMQILLSHPTSLKLNIDKRVEADLFNTLKGKPSRLRKDG
jgi:inosine-uridine nucleoside N-ribohydrolase